MPGRSLLSRLVVTLMRRPHLRLIISGTRLAAMVKGAMALTSKNFCDCSSVTSQKRIGFVTKSRRMAPEVMPALFTRISMCPRLSTVEATADREDVVPAAIRQAGGRVERVGMPVDPGNRLRSEEHTSELQTLMRISYAA